MNSHVRPAALMHHIYCLSGCLACFSWSLLVMMQSRCHWLWCKLVFTYIRNSFLHLQSFPHAERSNWVSFCHLHVQFHTQTLQWSRSQSILSRMLISGRGYQPIALLSCDTPACGHLSSYKNEPRCKLQAVAVLPALELLSEGACPQRLSQIARQLCQWRPHRYLIAGSAQSHGLRMQGVDGHTIIKILAVTGEVARPATVSTRRALLQTGPALLGSLQCYALLLNELVYGCHEASSFILPQHLFGMMRAGMHFMLQASPAQAVGFQKVCSSFYYVHACHHLYKLNRMP